MSSQALPQVEIETNSLPSSITGVLEVNTTAVAQNYATLSALLPNTICAAVLKADAYGFGANVIATTLAHEGCHHFFVAHVDEGIALRKLLKSSHIYVLSGLLPDTAGLFVEHALIPILNDYGMLRDWVFEAQRLRRKIPCALHIDTGMHRNGFDQKDLAHLIEKVDMLEAVDLKFIMSHLVSSHDINDPLNEKQKVMFNHLRGCLPQAKASLADTGGVYLDPSFHYDIARLGKGLFGLFTPPDANTPLLPCLKILGRIIQVRTGYKGETVGYDATHTLTRESKLATIGVGFADGYDRRLSKHGHMEIQGFKAPVVGRISMDYTVIDVTDIPESLCVVGEWAELVNESLTLDRLALSIGTISRELSTGFGKRFYRTMKL